MKNIKIFSLLFCLLFAANTFAQTETIDTSWISNVNGKFYRNKMQVLPSGDQTTSASPLGDTAMVARRYTDEITALCRRYAFDLDAVSHYRKELSDLLKYGKDLEKTIGLSPLDSLRSKQKDLLSAGWKIKQGMKAEPIYFQVDSAGTLHYKQEGTKWKASFFLGDIIQLQGFAGHTTDFYKQGKRWRTMDNRYSIVPPSDVMEVNIVNIVNEIEYMNQPRVTLESDGSVGYGEKRYTYDKKKKTWVTKQ